MRAGRRDRLIVIEEPIEVDSTTGDEVVTWLEFNRSWAYMAFLKSDLVHSIVADFSESDVKFTIPYVSGITTDMRISYGALIYKIDGLVEHGRRQMLEIFTSQTEIT